MTTTSKSSFAFEYTRANSIQFWFYVLSFVYLTSLVGCCKDAVYCPLGSFHSQSISLHAYLRVRADGTPELVEIRRMDTRKGKLTRREEILFRAIGFQNVKMDLYRDKVRFRLYANAGARAPDTVLHLNVWDNWKYFEFELRNDSQ